MMNKKTLLSIGVAGGIFVAAFAVFFFLKNNSLFDFAEIVLVNQDDTIRNSVDGEGTTEAKNEDANINHSPFEYRNKNYGFSFHASDNLKTAEFSDEKGDVVLVENETGKSFQIFIQPFDEQGPLFPEQIRQDIPTLAMRNIRFFTLDEAPIIVFESEEPSLGSTIEIWFVYPDSPTPNGNYLYQITAQKEFTGELFKILDTWKFEN